MVGAGAAHDGLVKVVIDGVLVGKLFEIRSIALRHVVEGHGGGAFAGCGVVECGGLCGAIAASADGDFDPREEIVQAAAGVVLGGIVNVAVGLLPHLEEAMHRAVGVCVIRHLGAAELEHAFTQVVCIGDAGIKLTGGDSGCTGEEKLFISGGETSIGEFRDLQSGEGRRTRDGGRFRSTSQRWREDAVDALGLRTVGKSSTRGRVVQGRELRRERVVGTGLAVGLDDALGEQIGDCLAFLWRVGTVDMVKGTIFTDDDDDVLDGSRCCRTAAVWA